MRIAGCRADEGQLPPAPASSGLRPGFLNLKDLLTTVRPRSPVRSAAGGI